MVLFVSFQIILVIGPPELAVAVADLAPFRFLAQALEIVRISDPPLPLILKLASFLAGRLRANFLARMVFIRLELVLAYLAAHGKNISRHACHVKRF